MADVTTYDGIINRISAGYGAGPYYTYSNVPANLTQAWPTTTVQVRTLNSFITLPSLPSGVSKYRPTFLTSVGNGTISNIFGKIIELGNLNISTNTYTTTATMPTRRELGTNAVQMWSPLLCVVTTVLNALPGTLNINYTDQGGSAGTTSIALTASGSVGTACFANLATGDIGVQAVTNTTNRSGGTTPTGVITFYGILPLDVGVTNIASTGVGRNLITTNFAMLELGAGDKIGMIKINSNATNSTEKGAMWFFGEAT